MWSHFKIVRLRKRAAKRQECLCYYCKRLMTSQPQLSCTAEHLIARSNLGPDSPSNIVAACKFCNAMRHRLFPTLSPHAYGLAVQIFLRVNGWHERHPAWESLA